MADQPKNDNTTNDNTKRDNLKSFDAYRDENGQMMGQDSPTDVANAASLKRRLDGEASGEAETARLASGRKGENADEETAAETPADTIRQISDPILKSVPRGSKDAAGEAIDRATAALGQE